MSFNNFLKFYEIGYKGFFNYRRVLRFNKIINCIEECRKKYSSMRVLDAGCGTGAYSIFLRRLGYDVVGIDIDENKMCVGRNFREPADLRQGSVLQMPFSGNEFDLVLMTEVLEHIKEPSKVIGEISRVLKNNGMLVLSVPTKKYSKSFDDGDYHEKDGYDVTELAELFNGKFRIEKHEQSGFSVESAIKHVDFNMTKEKGLAYVKNTGGESVKFKLYKYLIFPVVYLMLSLDKFFGASDGLNLIVVCKKI